jgi:hypothetical protein
MSGKVLNFNQKKKENTEVKRRDFERVIFENLLGANIVLEEKGTIYPVSIVDISHSGCLFQVPWNMKKGKTFKEGDELLVRFYFTKGSYILAQVQVKYGKEYLDENGNTFMHYGAEFDESLPSFEALKSFIDFMYKFAKHSSIDKGDQKVYFL